MDEPEHETLDHELHRLCVTKSMHDAVVAAAREDMVPVAVLQRWALRDYLRKRTVK